MENKYVERCRKSDLLTYICVRIWDYRCFEKYCKSFTCSRVFPRVFKIDRNFVKKNENRDLQDSTGRTEQKWNDMLLRKSFTWLCTLYRVYRLDYKRVGKLRISLTCSYVCKIVCQMDFKKNKYLEKCRKIYIWRKV